MQNNSVYFLFISHTGININIIFVYDTYILCLWYHNLYIYLFNLYLNKDNLGIFVQSFKAEMSVLKIAYKLIWYKFEDFKMNINYKVCPNLYKLSQSTIKIPIASAKCERSF